MEKEESNTNRHGTTTETNSEVFTTNPWTDPQRHKQVQVYHAMAAMTSRMKDMITLNMNDPSKKTETKTTEPSQLATITKKKAKLTKTEINAARRERYQENIRAARPLISQRRVDQLISESNLPLHIPSFITLTTHVIHALANIQVYAGTHESGLSKVTTPQRLMDSVTEMLEIFRGLAPPRMDKIRHLYLLTLHTTSHVIALMNSLHYFELDIPKTILDDVNYTLATCFAIFLVTKLNTDSYVGPHTEVTHKVRGITEKYLKQYRPNWTTILTREVTTEIEEPVDTQARHFKETAQAIHISRKIDRNPSNFINKSPFPKDETQRKEWLKELIIGNEVNKLPLIYKAQQDFLTFIDKTPFQLLDQGPRNTTRPGLTATPTNPIPVQQIETLTTEPQKADKQETKTTDELLLFPPDFPLPNDFYDVMTNLVPDNSTFIHNNTLNRMIITAEKMHEAAQSTVIFSTALISELRKYKKPE